MDGITATAPAVFDPFHYSVDLGLRSTLFPLGFEFGFQTNSAAVLGAAHAAWDTYPRLFAVKPFEVRIAVDTDDPAPCPAGFLFHGQKHLLSLTSDASNFAVCDLRDRFAFCWISAATAANTDWFRFYYLDTIINMMLWHSHLTRVHASCVARDGRGVLLTGPSGAGKSCLAFACARSGWTFISDEASSLLRGADHPVVLGKPHQFHFRETALKLLPELAGRQAVPTVPGKLTIELRTSEIPRIRTGYQCDTVALVFLNRHAGGPARLVPFSKAKARELLEQDLPLFQQPAHDEHTASLRNLVETGVYELRYGDLEGAVTELESLVI
ncbi:MAG: hypothetical protein LLG20_23720 [Acidobacteriales bacterium]|nr:hypothetical protein [Terriglobales bacterium]